MPKFTSAEVEITSSDKTGPGIKSAQGKIGALTKLVKSYFIEIAAAYAIVRKLMQVVGDLTQEWAKQETAVAKLNTSLKNAGIYTPGVSLELQNLADKLQKTTTYGDEATLEMASLLASLGRLNKEGLKQVIPLVQDMASTMGMDLNTAAALVGKTLGSSANALARYGFQVEKGASQTEKLTLFTKWATDRFGGMSEALGDTFQGRMTKLNNQISDLKEGLGRMLAEGGRPFTDWLTEVLIKINENFPQIERRVKQFTGIWAAAWAANIKIVETFQAYSQATITTIIKIFEAGKLAITGHFKEAGESIKDIGEMWKSFGTDFRDGWKNYIENTITKFNEAWGGAEKPLSILEQHRKTVVASKQPIEDMGDAMEVTTKQTEDYIKTWDEWQRARFGARSPADEGGFGDIVNEEDIQNAQDYAEAFKSSLGPMVEELTMSQTALAYFKDYVQNDFQPTLVDAWESIWTSTGDTFGKIKEAFKDMVVQFLIGLAKMYAAQAVALMFLHVWGRAAKLLAASAGLYAAASVVRSLAKGGEFVTQGPELMVVGDNPSGRERVSVTPAESPAYNQPQGGGPIGGDVYFDGDKVGHWIARQVRSKNIPIYKGALVSS